MLTALYKMLGNDRISGKYFHNFFKETPYGESACIGGALLVRIFAHTHTLSIITHDTDVTIYGHNLSLMLC